MKNLNEYIVEAINEAKTISNFDTDDTHCIFITDINGDDLDMDENVITKIYKKSKSFYKNDEFAKEVFKAFPKAETIWYTEYTEDGELAVEPLEFIERDKVDDGWYTWSHIPSQRHKA